MKSKILHITKLVTFLCIGLFFLWLVYKDEDIYELYEASKQANYYWIGLSMLIGLLSHFSRAMRWNILIEQLGYKPRLSNTFSAVLVMYLSNIAIPRSGEIARCGIIKQYEKIPFSKLFGTVFLERIVDLILLLILLAAVLITQLNQIVDFFQKNVSIEFVDKLSSAKFIIAGIISLSTLMIIGMVFRKKFRHTFLFLKVRRMYYDFLEGINIIRKLDKPFLFIGHSLFIYLMYFLMIYVCFFAFEETSNLLLLQGLAIFVMASLGMVAPAPGGIGTWHFMVIGTLFIYGIPEIEAKVFAIVVHGSMTLMLAIAGFVSLILLPLINNNRLANKT